jgi:hypothetical protein
VEAIFEKVRTVVEALDECYVVTACGSFRFSKLLYNFFVLFHICNFSPSAASKEGQSFYISTSSLQRSPELRIDSDPAIRKVSRFHLKLGFIRIKGEFERFYELFKD